MFNNNDIASSVLIIVWQSLFVAGWHGIMVSVFSSQMGRISESMQGGKKINASYFIAMD